MKHKTYEMQMLHELVRKAYDLIAPFSVHDDLEWFMNKNMRTKHLEKFPKCWKKINKQGRELPFFPICNRMGMEDAGMIDKSLTIAQKMKDKPDIDQDKLLNTLRGLMALKSKFSKPIPKPTDAAIRKGKVTRNMNTVGKYLKTLR